MIEDINAQNHALVDTFEFHSATIAHSALLALSRTNHRNASPFAHLLGIQIVAGGDGKAEGEMEVLGHLLNAHGIAHGGVTYAFGDHILGMAAVTSRNNPRIVTQDMQIRYHGPARPGKISCHAQAIHVGTRTITVEGKVYQGDLLIASLTGTYAILSDKETKRLTTDD